jgi:hypothetical protein
VLVSLNNGGNGNVRFPNHDAKFQLQKADILLDLKILCWQKKTATRRKGGAYLALTGVWFILLSY